MRTAIRPFRVRFVQHRGTSFEVGRAQAMEFAATPKGRAFLRRRTVRLPWWFNLGAEQRMFAKFSPALWEEITGIADGLGVPMERALLFFGNEGLRPPIGACSAVMTGGVYGRVITARGSRCCRRAAATPASAPASISPAASTA